MTELCFLTPCFAICIILLAIRLYLLVSRKDDKRQFSSSGVFVHQLRSVLCALLVFLSGFAIFKNVMQDDAKMFGLPLGSIYGMCLFSNPSLTVCVFRFIYFWSTLQTPITSAHTPEHEISFAGSNNVLIAEIIDNSLACVCWILFAVIVCIETRGYVMAGYVILYKSQFAQSFLYTGRHIEFHQTK